MTEVDYFGIFLDCLCLIGQGITHTVFVSRFTEKKFKPRYAAVYTALLFLVQQFISGAALPNISAVSAEILLLYGISHYILGNKRLTSCAAALFAVYISQLSFGMVNSAQAVLFPGLIGNWLLYPLLVLSTLAAFGICAYCYATVLKFLSLSEEQQTSLVWMLLLPGLFSFAAELYVLDTAYSAMPSSLVSGDIGKHVALLLLQALGLGALLCTLYAYRRLLRGLRDQAELRSLTQAAHAQKVYIEEARIRYERTRAFRHDVKNHLSVLDSLLRQGKTDEGRAYLAKLTAASDALSLPYRTGEPVVDILLGEKLGLAEAEGITAEVSLLLPANGKFDELDLCVLFANALDNAIHACQAVQGARSIRVSGTRQGDFYMISFENTCPPGPPPTLGIGITNIESVAEKYHGAIMIIQGNQRFSLRVMLNIS